jgi:type-F conjugative transfer system pilin assembly protein TrbC
MNIRKLPVLALMIGSVHAADFEGISLEVSEDFLEEANRIVQQQQAPDQNVKDWDLVKNAEETLNSITVPEGSWPLEEMGIQAPGSYPYHLYIMVSDSMPEGLIRSYAFDAIQSGAKVVIKGINPDENIQEATQKWAKLALREDGASPGITIDPRPFSAFEVDIVPAIVLSTKPVDELCQETEKMFSVSHDTAGDMGTLPYKTCMPADPNSFYKITGNVSVPWALKSMASVDDVPVLRDTAASWFSVMPERYNASAESFGWAAEMTGEDFSKTGDPEAVRQWLESISRDHPNLEVVETEKGLGLGQKQ